MCINNYYTNFPRKKIWLISSIPKTIKKQKKIKNSKDEQLIAITKCIYNSKYNLYAKIDATIPVLIILYYSIMQIDLTFTYYSKYKIYYNSYIKHY